VEGKEFANANEASDTKPQRSESSRSLLLQAIFMLQKNCVETMGSSCRLPTVSQFTAVHTHAHRAYFGSNLTNTRHHIT
jgi:hypothetical protein